MKHRTFKQFLVEEAIPFADTTGMPMFDDMVKNPEYFEKEKGAYFVIVTMSPDKYLDLVNEYFKNPFKPQETLVKEYAQRMQRGEKAPMLTLVYTYDENGDVDFSQEGRHRAYAAKLLNANVKVMVVVRASSWKVNDSKEFQKWKNAKLYKALQNL